METRGTVVSVRLDERSLQAIDLLVQAGLAQSRSEAAAQLVAIGVGSAGDLLEQARSLADSLQRIKQDFVAAIRSRDVAQVAALLDQKPGLVNARTEEGETLILMAVYNGAREVAEMLLARGAHLNLWEAAAVGNLPRLQAVLADDPSLLGAFSHDGWTALHLTAFFGHEAAAAYLLEQGADPRTKSRNGMGNTPLHAAMAGRHTGLARCLVTAGADVNAQDSAGWVPLHHAAYSDDVAMAELFIAGGADVNTANFQGQRPLGLALQRESTATADLLRRHGGEA